MAGVGFGAESKEGEKGSQEESGCLTRGTLVDTGRGAGLSSGLYCRHIAEAGRATRGTSAPAPPVREDITVCSLHSQFLLSWNWDGQAERVAGTRGSGLLRGRLPAQGRVPGGRVCARRASGGDNPCAGVSRSASAHHPGAVGAPHLASHSVTKPIGLAPALVIPACGAPRSGRG